MKFPCVGGHHDGQWIDDDGTLLSHSKPTIKLYIPVLTPLLYDPDPPPVVEMRVEYYVMQSIYTSEPYNESVVIASFWRHESLSEREAIRRLVAGYRQPMETPQDD